jgi:predicted ATPase/DNA-binding SARP family transcriptional activator
VPEQPDQLPERLLIEAIGTGRFLLVLDNCEHLIEACAALAERLLQACGELRILATSREALGIGGERTWLVPLLRVPTAAESSDPARASAVASVQLFAERARAAAPAFQLSSSNVAAVVDICQRLDGIPLAIELAAARVKVLAPEQIAARLHGVLALAPNNARGVRARHRTLRETIDWSCRMLSAQEQRLFVRLGVFAGSISLEAIEAVCTDAEVPRELAVDFISGLVDRSLVICEMHTGAARYRLLQTMRQYARNRLDESGEGTRIRQLCADYYVAMSEAAEPRIFAGANDHEIQVLLEQELPNIRAVEDWCRLDRTRVVHALRIGAALHWFWFAQGRFLEGRSWLDTALAAAPDVPPIVRARALIARGHIAIWQGDPAAIRPPLEEAIAILRTLTAPKALVVALTGLSTAALGEGDMRGAEQLIDEALALLGDDPSTVLLPFALYWRGIIATRAGRLSVARASLEQAVAAGRVLAHRPAIAHPLYALAMVDLQEGHVRQASARLVESLAIHHTLGDRWGLFQAFAAFAQLASEVDPARAARLIGASDAVRAVLGVQLPPQMRDRYEQLVATVHARLGDERFMTGREAGRSLTVDEMVALAREPVGMPAAAVDVGATRTPSKPRGRASVPDLRVLALGPVEVFRKGKAVASNAWGSAKARELLVLLLCHPEGCTKDRAAAALWPDASAAQVRNNFHVTLHRIRKALGDGEWITVEGDRYAVNPALDVEFDVRRFETEAHALAASMRAGQPCPPGADAVLARYRGDFLEHEEAGDWHQPRRQQLVDFYLEMLLACGTACVESGRDGEGLAFLRRLVARDAANEAAARRMFVAFAHLGDRGSARRLYDQLVAVLRDEFDAEPQPETLAAYRAAVDVERV